MAVVLLNHPDRGSHVLGQGLNGRAFLKPYRRIGMTQARDRVLLALRVILEPAGLQEIVEGRPEALHLLKLEITARDIQ